MQTRSSVPPSSLLIPQAATGPPNGPGHPAAGLSRVGEKQTHEVRAGGARPPTLLRTAHILRPASSHLPTHTLQLTFYLQIHTVPGNSLLPPHRHTMPSFLILIDTHKHSLTHPHTQVRALIARLHTHPMDSQERGHVTSSSRWLIPEQGNTFTYRPTCVLCAPENKRPTGQHPQPRTPGLGERDHLLSTYHARALCTQDFI